MTPYDIQQAENFGIELESDRCADLRHEAERINELWTANVWPYQWTAASDGDEIIVDMDGLFDHQIHCDSACCFLRQLESDLRRRAEVVFVTHRNLVAKGAS